MEYTIKVTIPDELGGLLGVLADYEVKELTKDLGLTAGTAEKLPIPSEEAPEEAVAPAAKTDFSGLKRAAELATVTADGRTDAKALMVKHSYRKIGEIPVQEIPYFIRAFNDIALKHKNDA